MDFGFAVYPLTEKFQERTYMNSGVFQLPVYKGKLPSAFIELLQNDRDVHVSDRIEEFLVTKEFETYKNQ